MLAVPAPTPETRPDEFTIATPVLLLDHAPPVIGWDIVELLPRQMLGFPEIAAGNGATVTANVTKQVGVLK